MENNNNNNNVYFVKYINDSKLRLVSQSLLQSQLQSSTSNPRVVPSSSASRSESVPVARIQPVVSRQQSQAAAIRPRINILRPPRGQRSVLVQPTSVGQPANVRFVRALQPTSVGQSTRVQQPATQQSARVLRPTNVRQPANSQRSTRVQPPRQSASVPQTGSVGVLAYIEQSARLHQLVSVEQPENIRRSARVQQLANIQQQLANIGQPTNAQQQSAPVQQSESVGQSANVQQSAHARQLANVGQSASVLRPASIQQPAVIQPFSGGLSVNFQQPITVQLPANDSSADVRQATIVQPFARVSQPESDNQSGNVRQSPSMPHSANVPKPASVSSQLTSASSQSTGASSQAMSVSSQSANASSQPASSSLQPASTSSQSASVSSQPASASSQPASARNSVLGRLVMGNVKLSREQLKKLLENAKLKQNSTGSLEVRLKNDKQVTFVSRENGNEILDVTSFKFKITLVYRNLLRKWYISPGYSFVPETINLAGMLSSGTCNPVSEEVLDVVYDVRRRINAFIIHLTAAYEFIRDAQRIHRHVQFHLHPTLRKMILIFSEDAWPSDLQKFGREDEIVIRLKLDEKLRVCDITYRHKFCRVVKNVESEFREKLHAKLGDFFYFPLRIAFERFMEETSCNEQSTSVDRSEDRSESN